MNPILVIWDIKVVSTVSYFFTNVCNDDMGDGNIYLDWAG